MDHDQSLGTLPPMPELKLTGNILTGPTIHRMGTGKKKLTHALKSHQNQEIFVTTYCFFFSLYLFIDPFCSIK